MLQEGRGPAWTAAGVGCEGLAVDGRSAAGIVDTKSAQWDLGLTMAVDSLAASARAVGRVDTLA